MLSGTYQVFQVDQDGKTWSITTGTDSVVTFVPPEEPTREEVDLDPQVRWFAEEIDKRIAFGGVLNNPFEDYNLSKMVNIMNDIIFYLVRNADTSEKVIKNCIDLAIVSMEIATEAKEGTLLR
jgi:hypothetical protein